MDIAAFSGASKAEVVTKLQAAIEDKRSVSLVAYESRQAFQSTDAHRLVVPATSEEMAVALASAKAKLDKDEAFELYSGPDAGHKGKLAYLFPGQGSQYVDMGRELSCMFPELLESLEATGRDISAPRVNGTTQNEQNLSHPSCTVRNAAGPRLRRRA